MESVEVLLAPTGSEKPVGVATEAEERSRLPLPLGVKAAALTVPITLIVSEAPLARVANVSVKLLVVPLLGVPTPVVSLSVQAPSLQNAGDGVEDGRSR